MITHSQTEERDYQTVKISLMALGYTYAGNTTVRYLSSNYFGDEDNNDTESTVSSTQNMNDAQINHSPASANDVLDALRREMRQTRQESELLRFRTISNQNQNYQVRI